MFCTICGKEVNDEARFCQNCGARNVQPVQEIQYTPSITTYQTTDTNMEFMGFWIRMAAWTIDAIPLLLLGFPLPEAATFVVFLGWISYRVVFTAARGQTVGKMVCKLQVVNISGEKPTLTQAIGRELLSPFSIYLVNLWVAADPNKRGWHDHLCGTYVVRLQASGMPEEALKTAIEGEVARREEQRRQEHIRRQNERERKRELDEIKRKERSLQSRGSQNAQSMQVGDLDVDEVLDRILTWAPMFPQVASQLTGGRVSREQATLIVEILENVRRSTNSDGTLNAAFWLNYSVMQMSFLGKMTSGTISNQDIAVHLVYNFLVSNRLSND
ncbi:MAG: RDD family protein [Chloroflexota bacterium]|nr:RDD family protein [Chloroflexota bacterium]